MFLNLLSCACGSAFAACVVLCSQGNATEFFVSPSGSDTGDGSRQRPFQTLERASAAVREARKVSPLSVTVSLRAGDYLQIKTFELTEADSGSAESRITWQAYADEPVRLLGGRVLPRLTAVTDPRVLARLTPEARLHVQQVDLRSLGIRDLGGMKSRGFSRPTTPAHPELFYGGRPMRLARWPNEGAWEKIAGFPASSGTGDEHGGTLGALESGFFYAGDRPNSWRDVTNIWVHGYWAWDWANSYERIAELDREHHHIRTAPPYGLYGYRKNQRVQFINILEELDEPGEWFLEETAGILYFWPPELKTGTPEILLSLQTEPLIRLKGASYVTIRGMILEGTRGNAVDIQGGSSNLVAGCVIRNIGDNGVVVSGGIGHGIQSCDIYDTGDGGVLLSGGDRQTLKAGSHFVDNCHFQRQGRWSKCYVPAVQLSGVGLRATHNLIHDHPHAAILFSGNDHDISFNEIHHIALETGDVGAIYAGRDYSFRGNRIRHNYIHETGGVGMGSMGVYMDDCVSGTEVFGNIFYKVHWAMFIGGGRDHQVENNLFVDCDPAVRADGRGLDRSPVWRNMVNDYMRKQLLSIPLSLYRDRYPGLRALDAYYGPPNAPITGDEFKGVPPEGNVIAHNVAVGKWFEAGWNAKAEMFDMRDNLATTNRTIIGSPESGFAPAPDSTIWSKGFKAIPFEQIGLQKDAARERVQRVVSR